MCEACGDAAQYGRSMKQEPAEMLWLKPNQAS